MVQINSSYLDWGNLKVGITGANGALGKALTKTLRQKGAFVIGLTHSEIPNKVMHLDSPNEWIKWETGKESNIKRILMQLNILILNHGINRKGLQTNKDINDSLEINAISTFRLIEIYEEIAYQDNNINSTREVWVNTSEAEIQPALSPTYEISKRLIGEIVSIKNNSLSAQQKSLLRIRKIVLGPFKSELNPIGIMPVNLVSNLIIKQAEMKINLIIITPNPITYVLMPITELIRYIYFIVIKIIYSNR